MSFEDNRTKITATVVGVAGIGIVMALLFLPLWGDTTIFLTNEGGGTPTPPNATCAPNGGFVLAQNITDLCDVTIISPSTDQIIKYNGSQWINVNQTSFGNDTTTCNNIGLGNAFICVEGSNVNLRSLIGGSGGISISNNSDTVTIDNTLPESTNCNNVGSGTIIHITSSNCNAKSLKASTGLSISNDTDSITYTNTLPESTVCTNVGIGIQVFKDGNCNFRTILGSPDISVTQGTNEITIDFNGTVASSESTVCNNLDSGTFIIRNSTSGDCNVKSLKASTGLSISNDTTSITYTNTLPEVTVCTNDGHGAGNVCNGGNVHVKGLASGSGITITQNGTDIIVTSNAINESTVCSGQSGNFNIVASSSGGNCTFKNLVAGTGESLSSNSTHITITNTSPESTVCANVGSFSQVYKDGNCNFRTLKGSPDISITQGTNDVTIDYNGTIASESTVCSGQSGNQNIVASSSGGNCTFKNLLAGSGMTLSSNGTHITITNAGVISGSCSNGISCSGTNPLAINGSSLQNQETTTCTSAGGTTIIKTSSGGSCVFKGLTTGSGITVTSNTNDNQIKTNFANGTAISITGTTTQTFTNTSPESTTCTGQSGNHNIVASSSGGNCTFKNLVAGTGISVSNNSTHITITNTQTSESTTCSNLGSGTILCSSSGGNVSVKTLKAGLGLSISNTTNDVTYKTNFVNGTGISITGSTSQTFTNTGVISNSCSGGITCSGTNPSAFTVRWELLCEVTLGSSNGTITCENFTARRVLHIDAELRGTGGIGMEIAYRFNNDAGNNYAFRQSTNNGADTTVLSTSRCNIGANAANDMANNDGALITVDIDNNQSGDRKLTQAKFVEGVNSDAGTAPARKDSACKWANTSAQITRISFLPFTGTTTFNTGSLIRVWGYD